MGEPGGRVVGFVTSPPARRISGRGVVRWNGRSTLVPVLCVPKFCRVFQTAVLTVESTSGLWLVGGVTSTVDTQYPGACIWLGARTRPGPRSGAWLLLSGRPSHLRVWLPPAVAGRDYLSLRTFAACCAGGVLRSDSSSASSSSRRLAQGQEPHRGNPGSSPGRVGPSSGV